MKIKVYEKEGELVSKTENFIIVNLEGDEQCFDKKEEVVLGWVRVPCEDCGTDCYNFQIGDCKNYEWRIIK